MDHRQLLRIVKGLELRQAGMKSKEPVEVNCRRTCGSTGMRLWLWNGDCGAHRIIIFLSKRYDHVQPIHSATLEDRHENFAPADPILEGKSRAPHEAWYAARPE